MHPTEMDLLSKLPIDRFRQALAAVSLPDTIMLRDHLFSNLTDIETQLGHTTRHGPDGLPMTDREFAAWKFRAIEAHGWKQAMYRIAKGRVTALIQKDRDDFASLPLSGQAAAFEALYRLALRLALRLAEDDAPLDDNEKDVLRNAHAILLHAKRKARALESVG